MIQIEVLTVCIWYFEQEIVGSLKCVRKICFYAMSVHVVILILNTLFKLLIRQAVTYVIYMCSYFNISWIITCFMVKANFFYVLSVNASGHHTFQFCFIVHFRPTFITTHLWKEWSSVTSLRASNLSTPSFRNTQTWRNTWTIPHLLNQDCKLSPESSLCERYQSMWKIPVYVKDTSLCERYQSMWKMPVLRPWLEDYESV